jgi:uncharacterized protein YodC (DUF2158 family)
MQIGDTLYMKSGGRPVTVIEISDDGTQVKIAWMNGNSISRDMLPAAVLVADNPEPALAKARRDLEAALAPPAEEGGE